MVRIRGPERRRLGRWMVLLAVLTALAVIIPAGVLAARPAAPAPVTIQLLNASDWHGNVDPVGGFGGAWNLSARWQQDRQTHPTLTLAGGDDFGATPALVNFFEEEPAVKAQRLMGVQVGALGNHNFDRGVAHLQRMINLAAAPTSDATPGAPYRYVAANLKLNGELKNVDPMAYFDVGGVRVAVIGITNEEAPGLVLPGAFGRVQITDSVAAANKYAKQARTQADVVIVVTHKGIRGLTNNVAHGELIDFANAVDPNLIDVIIGDHTDLQYSGEHNGILVHENRSFGVTYTKTLLSVQPSSPGRKGGVIDKSVSFVSPGPAGALSEGNTSCGSLTFCDQAVVDMLVPYRQELAELLDEKVGTATLPFKNGGPSGNPAPPQVQRSGETALGDLITDGFRWKYSTQLALINGGGIRSQLPACSYLPVDTTLNRANYDVNDHVTLFTCEGYGGTAPYDIVLGDIFTVHPFGNIITTRTVTGAQLWTAMENGVSRIDSSGNGADGRFPQISGFSFEFRYDVPTGCHSPQTPGGSNWTACNINRVQSVTLADGTEIPNSNSATYSMALPNFVNLGGDNYFMFADGTGATQDLDAIVLKDYMQATGPNFDPTSYEPFSRIIECDGPCP